MEPTVRSPWIESAIITDRVRNVAFGLPNPKIPGSRRGSGRRKPCRGERNFWVQRREAKIGLGDRPNWLPPTQGSNQVSESRVRNGIFCCRDRAAKWAHSPRLQEQRPR